MFPVHAASGERIVGFLGRALAEDAGTPKYLNSPAAALYRKGELLYGLGTEPTRRALAAGARPVLVEGPLDAIAVTSAGAARLVGVAPCGTALTAAQVAPLETAAGSLAERGVLVALDADSGGRHSLRAYELLRPTGAWPTAAVLADGLDPAALAHQHGPEAPRTGLDGATTSSSTSGWPAGPTGCGGPKVGSAPPCAVPGPVGAAARRHCARRRPGRPGPGSPAAGGRVGQRTAGRPTRTTAGASSRRSRHRGRRRGPELLPRPRCRTLRGRIARVGRPARRSTGCALPTRTVC
jgi:DNA primase catalytic core, N-terminal domain/Toprim-like